MLKNKKKAPTGPKCPSTTSGYTCALTGEHDVHCNTEKRSGDRLTWTTVEDGRIKVTAHQGKNANTWHDEAPAAPAPNTDILELEDGTLYDRKSAIGPPVKLPESWTKKPKPEKVADTEGSLLRARRKKQAEERAEAKRKTTAKPYASKFCDDHENPGKTGGLCALEPGHEGDHNSGSKTWRRAEERMKIAQRDAVLFGEEAMRSAVVVGAADCDIDPRPLPSDFPDEPEDPEADIAAFAAINEEDVEDPLDDDAAARWHCEAMFVGNDGREHKCEGRNEHSGPHYAWSAVLGATVDEATKQKPSLTDACPKCGKELGEHDGKKCPKAPKVTRRSDGALTAGPPPDGRTVAEHLDELAAPLEKIGEYEVHPVATMFRMIGQISAKDWTAFLEDIRVNGLRKRIVRVMVGSKWLILDGRNRLRACLDLGIEPLFRDFGSEPGDGTDPISFVFSENLHRRHEDETSRAYLAAELVPMYEAQARARMVAGKRNPAPNSAEGESGEAVEQAAKAVNIGKTSVKAAITVKRDAAPEVLAASRDRGQIKVSTAADLSKLPKQQQREIVEKIGGGELRSGKVRSLVNQEKKRTVVRKINEGRVAPMPLGPFGVIYGDYPWHYENSDQHEGSRGHLGYATMKMDEVLAHAADTARRAAKDCIIALWSTNLYVTKMERVLAAYGAEARTVFTWPKPKFGIGTWGRGQTEHLVIASIGEPTHTLNEISTLLQPFRPARPGEHSSKPNEVAELLAKHCSGPFLELFAREQREGWICWGAEVDKFTRAA